MDELIKRLRCQHFGNCPNCPMWYTEEIEPNLWRERCAAIDAADAIEELVKESERWQVEAKDWYLAYMNLLPTRWIPTTERLPFDGGKYLCKIKCPKGEWIEIDRWDGEDWYSTDWHEEKATAVVTHWMPLPEPPKEES